MGPLVFTITQRVKYDMSEKQLNIVYNKTNLKGALRHEMRVDNIDWHTLRDNVIGAIVLLDFPLNISMI